MAFYSAVVAARTFAAAAVDLLSSDLIDNSDCEAADNNYYACADGTSGALLFCVPIRLPLLYFNSFDSSIFCNRDALA